MAAPTRTSEGENDRMLRGGADPALHLTVKSSMNVSAAVVGHACLKIRHRFVSLPLRNAINPQGRANDAG